MGPEDATVVERAETVLNEALELVYENDELALLTPPERRLAVRALLGRAGMPELVTDVAELVDGYGPLTHYMEDAEITDVFVNGPHEVWVERSGRLEKTCASFHNEDVLLGLIRRLVATAGGRVDPSRPITDVKLSDGSRMHVVLPPLSPRGPLLSIRRFPTRFELDGLVERGLLDDKAAEDLRALVSERRTIAISGATGSGKTTLMNALLSLIDASERVIVLEESAELSPSSPHVVSLLTRPPNVEGKGEITLQDLFRAALRMRPDRIVVGEVRGLEARVALEAMSTGHAGSFVTVHASSARAVRTRVARLSAGADATSIEHFQGLFDVAFDFVVHLERSEGRRRLTEIHEVGHA